MEKAISFCERFPSVKAMYDSLNAEGQDSLRDLNFKSKGCVVKKVGNACKARVCKFFTKVDFSSELK